MTITAGLSAEVQRGTLRALARCRQQREALDERQAQLVADARAGGATWAEIGGLLGVTGQAVSMRYGGAVGNGF